MARTNAEENKTKEKNQSKHQSEAGYSSSQYPTLPKAQLPAGLSQTLGQHVQAGPKQQQLSSNETMSFLGQLLIQGLIQCLQPQGKERVQEKEREKEQEKRSPALDLVKLMNLLTHQ